MINECQFLVKDNINSNVNGYFLGQPFLTAFSFLMDYENNRIGFGTKINAKYGASVKDKHASD